MTKKQLLKWLDDQKIAALRKVSEEESKAKEELMAWKLAETKFDELVAEIGPKLNEVYDRMTEWREKYKEICGPERMYGSGLKYHLTSFVFGSRSLAEILKDTEFTEAQHDKDLKAHYTSIRAGVERTYANVGVNLRNLANAKLGMEYLESLGFDLTELKAGEERPVKIALAVPINTQFLLLNKKEA